MTGRGTGGIRDQIANGIPVAQMETQQIVTTWLEDQIAERLSGLGFSSWIAC